MRNSRRSFLRALGMGGAGLAVPGLLAAEGGEGWRAPARSVCNILDHGGRGDGRFDNRLAIQNAIDACAARGGGTVHVPAGRFVTGSVRLKSHVRLELEAGAVLVGSSSPGAYEVRLPTPHVPRDAWGSALLLAEDQEHVSVGGRGTITGGGLALTPDGEQGPFRPRLLSFERCRQVQVEDVTLLDSDRWTLHFYDCDHVRASGLGIYAGLHVLNTDGIDVDGSRNVLISDCDIAVGDDCVCLKTTDYLGPPRPCRNVTVTNCAFATRSTGFKIGTETHADFSNVVFSNSVIYAHAGVEPHTGIALESVDGAHLSGVAVTNVAMEGVVAPIFLRLGNRGRRQPTPTPGTLRDVVIQNVVATGASLASSVTGIPGHDVERVSLQNVRIQARGGAAPELAERAIGEHEADYPSATMFGELPAYGLYVRHARDLSVRDLHLSTATPDGRPLLLAEDVEGLRIDGLFGDSAERARSFVRLRDARDVILRGSSVPTGVESWVHVEGAASRHILLRPDHAESSAAQVIRAPDVPSSAVTIRP